MVAHPEYFFSAMHLGRISSHTHTEVKKETQSEKKLLVFSNFTTAIECIIVNLHYLDTCRLSSR